MIDTLIKWFNGRFNKRYGVEVRVVEAGDSMFKVMYTTNGNDLLPMWHGYWSSLNEDVSTTVNGVAYFASEDAASKTALKVYDEKITKKAEQAVLNSTGKVVLQLRS